MTHFHKFCLATGLAALAFVAWFDAMVTILERTGV